MPFVQLQVISAYSLLQSTNSIEQLVTSAKNRGYTALALTDINVLYGAIDFYKACKKHNIKPIIGVTLDVRGVVDQDRNYKVIVLAKDAKGYESLLTLSSKKMLLEENEGIGIEDFRTYAENVIVLTPGNETGEAEYFLSKEDKSAARNVLDQWTALFERNDFYLGMQLQETTPEFRKDWMGIANTLEIKTVALGEVRYLNPEDHFTNSVLKAIDRGELVNPETQPMQGPYYLPPSEEAEKQFREAGLEQSAVQTYTIAEMIEIEIRLNQQLLPKYPLEKETKTSDFLKERCFEGLRKRVPEADNRYTTRLGEELSVIQKMGFEDYFLIVWDVMSYAHQSGIVTGAGRGSAAGSLVSYVLGITDVDPIEYNLLFERFLNEERYTMPDIDLDFPDNRREDVLQYVKNKYGKERVAQIATFGTLAAKMALRDTARVFGLDQSESNAWSKAIPRSLGISLGDAFRQSKALQELVNKSQKNKMLFKTAKNIEGLPRHISTHAAGVVISDQPLDQFVPLQRGNSGISLTQYPMGNVEEIGLLKMDFLGLKNLAIIDNALKSIKHQTGKNIQISQIPIDDPKALEVFRKADTVGIFQFESAGIKNVLRKLGPSSIEDVAAVNALYRPGPMEQIDTFIRRKKGEAPIEYPHDDLKEILGVTYGVMVYQEQVMQVASKMAGYTLGQADILRRAIGKKQKSVIDKEREHFTSGARKLGYTTETASMVYDYIERFANYGFNRSHAVAYSFIAYQMAYLKAHYPEAFFVALLNSAAHSSAKMKEYILEAKQTQIEILPPDINESYYSFTLKDKKILFGLGNIKGVRSDLLKDIIRERKENGRFKDMVDFLRRMDQKWLKAETIVPFIYAGAFDGFGYNRGTLLHSLEGILSSVKISGNNLSLFDILQPKYEQSPDLSIETKLEEEQNYLGIYLSGHPTEKFEDIRRANNLAFINELHTGENKAIIGQIKNVRKIRTKRGEPMAFSVVSDVSGDCSLTLFPATYRKFSRLLQEGDVLVISGKTENGQDNRIQMIVNEMKNIEELSKSMPPTKCFIRISREKNQPAVLGKVESVLKNYHGDVPVILYYEETNRKMGLGEANWVNGSDEFMVEMEELLGKGNVIIQ